MTRRERFYKALKKGWAVQEFTAKGLRSIYGEEFDGYNARLLTVTVADEEYVEARYDDENGDFYIKVGVLDKPLSEKCYVFKSNDKLTTHKMLKAIAITMDEAIRKGEKIKLNILGE